MQDTLTQGTVLCVTPGACETELFLVSEKIRSAGASDDTQNRPLCQSFASDKMAIPAEAPMRDAPASIMATAPA